ncbi:MAG: YIP1 family protein [Methanomicrobiales archaeon]|nr:YIP1 family protein [Methanomicrobiales archaeon]
MVFSPLQLILTPDAFFEEKLKEPENLNKPLPIFIVLGVLGAISAYLVTQVTMQALPREVQDFAGIATGMAVVGGIFGVFIMWLVVAVVLYALSALFKGSGTFKRTLEFIGYGFFPQLIGSIIGLYLMYDFSSTVKVQQVSSTDPQLISDAISSLMNHPSFILASIVGILFLLWSANLWIFGLKHARTITMRNAVFAVLAPVAIYIIYSSYNLLKLLGGGI